MSKISKVGLELEGGWKDKSDKAPFNYPIGPNGKDIVDDLHFDVSVGNTAVDPSFRMTSPHVGEIASPPLLMKDVEKWLEEHYPSEVNASCGFHVHVSFKSVLDYGKLMEEEFWNHFLNEAEKWGKAMKFGERHQFWPRLHGNNRFCFARFQPEEQVFLTTKPQDGPRRDLRRTHLNYCWAFPNEDGSMRKTLECRVFPQFKDVKVAFKAVEWLVSLYEGWLSSTPREKRITYVLKKEDLLKPERKTKATLKKGSVGRPLNIQDFLTMNGGLR